MTERSHTWSKTRAQQWLKDLQRAHFDAHMASYHAAATQYAAQHMNVDKEMTRDPLGWVDHQINTQIVTRLHKYLPTSHKEAITDIPVGTLYTSDPNAYAIRPLHSDCGPVIIIDWSLFIFLGQIIRPIMCLIQGLPPDQRIVMVQRIWDCGEYFASNARRGRLEWHEYDATLWKIAGPLGIGSLLFVLGHEYAHVFLGHLNTNDVSVSELGFAKYHKSWEQEYSADLEGLRLAKECLQSLEEELLGSSVSRLPCASPIVAMSVIRLFEKFVGERHGRSSHPPTKERRWRLATALEPTLSRKASFVAEWFEHIVDQPMERVVQREKHS